MIIDLQRFVAAERPCWSELERALDKLEAEPDHRMALDELQRFHRLYERTAADLARIITFSSEAENRRYLETSSPAVTESFMKLVNGGAAFSRSSGSFRPCHKLFGGTFEPSGCRWPSLWQGQRLADLPWLWIRQLSPPLCRFPTCCRTPRNGSRKKKRRRRIGWPDKRLLSQHF